MKLFPTIKERVEKEAVKWVKSQTTERIKQLCDSYCITFDIIPPHIFTKEMMIDLYIREKLLK